MQKIFTKSLMFLFSITLFFNFLPASSFEDHKKMQMIQDLEVIKHHYQIGYAPAQWKKDYWGWDLDQAFESAKNQILTTPSITTKQFQVILHEFINTMKDYHVDVFFFSTESSALPFSVKGAGGRYFIDWIDPLRLPSSHYSIQVGDELLEFDDQPIADVMENLIQQKGKCASPSTDQALAEMALTHRLGMAGDLVPQGPIMIKTQSMNSERINTYQLHWSYTPEYVKNPLDFIPTLDFISGWMPDSKAKTKIQLPEIKMANPLHENYAKKYADRDGTLGARKSFVPLLGELLWMTEGQLKKRDPRDIDWFAYIYRHPDSGKVIGYIRIPHYMGFSPQAREFGEILNIMEENTDALVIDQVHNFGGLVAFQYELASMLAIDPLKAPHHQIKITQKEVLEAHRTLEFIKLIDLILLSEGSDAEEKVEKGEEGEEVEEGDNGHEEEDDLGFNYQEIMFLKVYYELILDEWSKGHTLTRPTPILGIDRINPHPKYRYTKPILMLIDELDFSGADFMPAILQDNHRAVLFGNRTAGAGGFVFSFEFPNSHGIAMCSYTASIAERANLQKIENLGVTPDIEYKIMAEDLQSGYQGYVNAVNQALLNLLPNTEEPLDLFEE